MTLAVTTEPLVPWICPLPGVTDNQDAVEEACQERGVPAQLEVPFKLKDWFASVVCLATTVKDRKPVLVTRPQCG